MSIALAVEWPDGKAEQVHIASHAGATKVWARMAAEHGMSWVPLFSSSLRIDHGNLPQVIDEVRHMADLFGTDPSMSWDLENAQNLLALLERMKLKEGWTASIG